MRWLNYIIFCLNNQAIFLNLKFYLFWDYIRFIPTSLKKSGCLLKNPKGYEHFQSNSKKQRKIRAKRRQLTTNREAISSPDFLCFCICVQIPISNLVYTAQINKAASKSIDSKAANIKKIYMYNYSTCAYHTPFNLTRLTIFLVRLFP